MFSRLTDGVNVEGQGVSRSILAHILRMSAILVAEAHDDWYTKWDAPSS